jgi:hypothetical protein
MRSSKSRQRNKQNRNNRPMGGNIINRVFDSSGPEGKVRGTPQQIIEKYLQLHRDAHLAGDRVNAENFAQHAEHYTRLLAEALREVERAREEQESWQRERQAERDREHQALRERHPDRERRLRPPAEEQGAPAVNGDAFDGASFLAQPLFPLRVAEPEDDMIPVAEARAAAPAPRPERDRPERDRPERDRTERDRTVRTERDRPEGHARPPRERRPWRDGPAPEAVTAQPAPEAVTAQPAPEAVTAQPVTAQPEMPAAAAAPPEPVPAEPRAERAPRRRRARPRAEAELAPPDAAE